MWTLETALSFVRELEARLRPIGYSVALGGSVLLHGKSPSHLDLVIYPLSSKGLRPQSLKSALLEHGLTQVATRERVQQVWRRKGSDDTKHVEIWRTNDRRVDLFFLQ